MAVLIAGRVGYIGSHMVKRLLEEGESVVVADNLSTGFRDAVLGGEFRRRLAMGTAEGECLVSQTGQGSAMDFSGYDICIVGAGLLGAGSVR
jgi:UDP-glucose 4-epimerase